jgi:hypothetical protein
MPQPGVGVALATGGSLGRFPLRPVAGPGEDCTNESQEKRGGGWGLEAYCMKCKQKREMKKTEQIQMKNGRPATRGECTTCGTKMFKIGDK